MRRRDEGQTSLLIVGFFLVAVLLVVVGAAINAESERQTIQDSTVGRDRPPGERGAVVADSLPPPTRS